MNTVTVNPGILKKGDKVFFNFKTPVIGIVESITYSKMGIGVLKCTAGDKFILKEFYRNQNNVEKIIG